MNAFKLLEAYVQLSVRGDKDVDRALAAQEKRAEATEKKAERIGSGYERGAKKAGKAVGKLTEGVAKLNGATDELRKKEISLKTRLDGAKQVQTGLDSLGERVDSLSDGTVTLTAKLEGARETINDLEALEGVETRIDGDTVRITARVDGTAEGAERLQILGSVAERTEGQVRLDVDVAGAAPAIGELTALNREASIVDGRTVTLDADTSGIDRLERGISSVAGQVRDFRTLMASFAIPGFIAAIGGGVPLVFALLGGVVQLGSAVGQGLAGAFLVGGTAVAGAVGGLAAYRAALTSTITASREAYAATHEHRMEMLEARKQSILQTRASESLNRQIDRSSLAWARVQAAIGRVAFPTVTRELGAWTALFPRLQRPLLGLVAGVTRIGGAFSQTLRTGQGLLRLEDVLQFVARSGTLAAGVLSNIGKVGLLWANQLIPAADRLQLAVARIVSRFQGWAESTRGTMTAARVFGFLEAQMYRLFAVVGNVARAFWNVGAAVNRGVNLGALLSGVAALTKRFADATSSGGKLGAAITGFVVRSRPALSALGRLALTVAREIGILADNVIRAGQSGGRIGTLARVVNSLTASVRPLRLLFQQTFVQLGPALARLIPAVVNFGSAFLGSSNVLVSFVNRITGLLNFFNNLPGPVKAVAIELVALNGIMKLLGGPTILGLVGGISRAATTLATYRAASAASAAATSANNVAMGASGSAAAAGATKMGFFARAGALASVTARGLGVALRFMLGPWGLLIAGVALGVTLLIRNWSRIRPALQPAINLFNQVKNAVGNLARVFTGVLTGNLDSARAAFMRLPAGLRPLAMALARVATQIRAFVARGLAFLRAQGARLLAWWRSAWPQIQRVAQTVLQALGRVVRAVAAPVFRFLMNQARTVVNWFRKNWPLIQRTASTVFGAVRRVVQSALRFVWNNVIKPVVGAIVRFWKQNHQQITSILKAAWNTVKTIVKTAIRVVLGIVKATMQAITGDWKGAWNTIKQVLQVAWNAIKQLVKNSLTIVKNLLKVAWNVVKSLTSAAWEAVKNSIGDKLQAANQKAKQILGWLTSGLKSAWESIKSAASAAWSAISGAIWHPIETAYNKVTDFIGKILGAVNSVLEKVGLDPIGGGSSGGSGGGSNPGGTSNDDKVAPKQFGRARGGVTLASGRVLDAHATGGIGGLSGPRQPRVHLWGEGDHDEGFITTDPRHRRDNLGYLGVMARKLGQVVVPKGQRGGDFGGGHAAYRALDSFATGGLSEEAVKQMKGRGEEALGKPYIYGPTGTHAGPDGYTCSGIWNYITTGSHAETGQGTYAYMAGKPGWEPGGGQVEIGVSTSGEGGFDGTHMAGDIEGVSYESTVPAGVHHGRKAGDGFQKIWHIGDAGEAASGGGSGTGVLASLFEAAWNRLVQPVVDTFLKPLKDSSYVLAQAAGAAAQKIPDGIKEWAMGKLSAVSGGEWSGGGNVDEWITEGFKAGSAFEDTAENHAAMKGRVMQESGGDPNAVNDWDSNAAAGTPSKGLVQIIEPTWEQYRAQYGSDLGPFDDNWNNPVKSVGVASRYMKGAYGHVVGSNGSGYAEGGIAGRGRGPRVRMPRPVERAFVAVADALKALAGRGSARGNPGLALAPDGGVATGDALVGIAGDGGAESMVPLERYTPQGALALRTANRTWAARGWDTRGVPTFAKGGLLGVSGGRVIQGYGADHHGIDVAAPPGTAVNAWAPTEVTKAQQMGGVYGTQVWGYVASGGKRYGFVVGHLSRGAAAGKYPTGANLGTIGNIAGITPHAHWALSTAGMPPPGNTDPMSVYGGPGAGQSGVHSEPVPGGGGSLPRSGGGGGSAGGGASLVNTNTVRMSSGGGTASTYSRQGTGADGGSVGGGSAGDQRSAAVPFGDLGLTKASLSRAPDGGALAERIIARLERVEDATRANKVVDLAKESRDDIKEGPRAYAGTREFGDRVNGHVDRRDEQARRQGVR